MGALVSSSSSSGSTNRRYTDMHRREVTPGDLMEIFRDRFQHWAVYVGDGYVVHLVVPGQGGNSSSMTFLGTYGVVMKERLEDVVGDDSWRINNILEQQYQPRPVQVILKEAFSMVGASLQYNVFTNNCEHFATEIRYGKPESRQAQMVVEAGVLGGLVFGLGAVVLGLLGVNRA